MALHHSFVVAAKTGKKSSNVVETKRLAMYTSAVKAFVIENTKSIRSAFFSIASAMKGKK